MEEARDWIGKASVHGADPPRVAGKGRGSRVHKESLRSCCGVDAALANPKRSSKANTVHRGVPMDSNGQDTP